MQDGIKPSDAELLRPFLLEERADRLDRAISSRLSGLTVVLEHLHDEGNISAVLRSCEAFGVQHVHVIEQPSSEFRIVNDITQGCHRWLDIYCTRDGPSCIEELRRKGFRIYGSFLGEGTSPLEALDFSAPAALVFGNEHEGITEDTLARCDRTFAIEMHGLTRSFNVSVAAALTLGYATGRRRSEVGASGDLADDERERLRDRWYRAEVRDAGRVLAELRARSRKGARTP